MALPQVLPGISVVSQAPTVDPRLFASDPQGALAAAQAGMHLGTEMAGLGNLKSRLALEKAELSAKTAQNTYNNALADHAMENIGPMVRAGLAATRASTATSNAAADVAPGAAQAQILANQNASAFQSSLADYGVPGVQAQTAGSTAQNLLSSSLASAGFSKLSPTQQLNQTTSAKTAGELGIPFDAGSPEATAPGIRGALVQRMTFPIVQQNYERGQAAAQAQLDKIPAAKRSDFLAPGPMGGLDTVKVGKEFHDQIVVNPKGIYGATPGFVAAYDRATTVRQAQDFMSTVPDLLDKAGDPTTMQKISDRYSDIPNGASMFKSLTTQMAASNIAPATAARTALISLIDLKLGVSLNSPNEARGLKNTLAVQPSDSNETIKAAVKQFEPSLEAAYNSAKAGFDASAFQTLDDYSVLSPKSVGAAGKGRLPGGAASASNSVQAANPLYGAPGVIGSIQMNNGIPYRLVIRPDGTSAWAKQPNTAPAK